MKSQDTHDEVEKQTNCWIWPDRNPKWFKDVTEYVKSKPQISDSFILLSVTDQGFCSSIPLMKFLISICRKYKLFHNEHTTFLKSKDHFLATQLCIANFNKKVAGDFGATMSDVLYCLKKYVDICQYAQTECPEKVLNWIDQYKDFLQLSNTIDEWQMLLTLQRHLQNKADTKLMEYFSENTFIIFGTPSNNILKKALEMLTMNTNINYITVESPLDASLYEINEDKRICVTSEIVPLETCITPSALNTSNHIQPISATKEYVQEIIHAFLRLLVNCRDELALGKAMVSPILNLSHTAFTDLKRQATQKEMPMCQTAISHVMCVRLGGQSYAPPKDCCLQAHMKGLGEFVDLIDKLHTVMDEDPSPESGVRRIIMILKNKLLKNSIHNLKWDIVEETVEWLIETALSLFKDNSFLQEQVKSNGTPALGYQTFLVLRELTDYLASSFSATDPVNITDDQVLNRTPLNIPSVFSYFRSPEEEVELKPPNQRVKKKEASSVIPRTENGFISIFSSVYQSKNSTSNLTPTKSSRLPELVTSPKENSLVNKNMDSVKGKPLFQNKKTEIKTKGKRSILKDITNESDCKEIRQAVKKTKRARKSTKLLKGQTQITTFFVT